MKSAAWCRTTLTAQLPDRMTEKLGDPHNHRGETAGHHIVEQGLAGVIQARRSCVPVWNPILPQITSSKPRRPTGEQRGRANNSRNFLKRRMSNS